MAAPLALPSSTLPMVLQTVSDQLAKPGIKGIALVAIGLVGVFFVIEMIIGKFEHAADMKRQQRDRELYDDAARNDPLDRQ